ncbi:MAG: aldo/keto reductase [Planctomycetes bacterium]|nr:aldo/keto reductase [Planctomycetota bacterium]
MPRVALAEGGPEVSRIAAGLWRLAEWKLDAGEIRRLIEACLEIGITTFDHADIYGDYTCEARFGAALAEAPGLRDRMELVTKCGIVLISENRPPRSIKHYDTSRTHILESVDNSLRALRTDRIDTLLIHRPDPLMDPDDVAAAFTALRDAGKVRSFGVSNFTPSQLALLASRLPFPLVTNQVEFSVLHMDPLDDGTIDQCQERRMAPMAWSPLAGGRLFDGQSERAERVRRTLAAVAGTHDASMDQIAIAWILRHPARIVPVLGTGKIERIRSAAGGAAIPLTREEWFAIRAASAGHDVS